MKTSEVITLIGILLTFIVSVITQIYTRKNIKHTKLVETFINSQYNNLKEMKTNLSIILQIIKVPEFYNDENLKKDVILNLISLKMELKLVEDRKELETLIDSLTHNIENGFIINYSEKCNQLFNEVIVLLNKRMNPLEVKMNTKLNKKKSNNHVWRFKQTF